MSTGRRVWSGLILLEEGGMRPESRLWRKWGYWV